jgi:hypothetical protein
MTCPDCEAACQRMKAQGFRNWRDHACWEHAGLNIDESLAELGYVPNEDNIRKAFKEMGLTYVGPDGPGPVQPDLFGEAA